jgi:predicted protein tyrosine phosphatase
MFIDYIQRHIAVCGRRDLPRIAELERGFWNVVSICGTTQPAIARAGFRRVHHVVFDDVFAGEGTGPDEQLTAPCSGHFRGIFRFTDEAAGEPVLVHCQAGISRSPAVALCLLVRSMRFDGFTDEEIVATAPALLLRVRPQAEPNPLVLETGLAEIFGPTEARRWRQQLLAHEALAGKRL